MGVRTASTMTTSRPVDDIRLVYARLTGESANIQYPLPERLGIVGSGTIARGLAALAARHGRVTLCARSERSAATARDWLDADAVDVTCDREQLAQASFVVEAIVEEHAAKTALFAELAEILGPEAILATTTSSLSAAELGAESGRPERFAALHVFNPVTKMALVELAFPEAATADTRERTRALCEALGKTAVDVADTPGFVVNRLLFPYLFDAVELLERTGMEPKAVDTCMKLGAGHPLGPLALLDLVGLDVSKAIGETIGAKIPARVEALIAEGALGRKTGRGFHTYET
jgi:3-hydroxybutyryl-CoA dehydrogenase